MSAAPPPAGTSRLGRDLRIALLALLLLAAWDASGLDLAAAHLFGSTTGFAWRDHWALAGVGHDGARLLGWALLAALFVNAVRPVVPGLTRRERWAWPLLTAMAALAIPLVKRGSLTSCPWELAEFGGAAHYVSHWLWGVADGGPGHCFPSGHATTAFAALSGWFVLRRAHPRAARAWLAVTLGAGLALGAVQLARGAHYPSHTLWTGWLCWMLGTLAAPWLASGAPEPVASQADASANA